jgi:hypothetical protein
MDEAIAGAMQLGAERLRMIKTQAVGFLSYMATLRSLNGRRYFTYSNDHVPAHIHVSTASGKAKFELSCPSGPCKCVLAQRGLSDPELNSIRKEIDAMLSDCCLHWRTHHGPY